MSDSLIILQVAIKLGSRLKIDHLEIFNNWLRYRDMISGDCDSEALLHGS